MKKTLRVTVLYLLWISCAGGTVENQMGTEQENEAPLLNQHIWLELSDIGPLNCGRVVINVDMVSTANLKKIGFDKYVASKNDVVSVLKEKQRIANPEEYLEGLCFESPYEPKDLGYSSIEELVNDAFGEIEPGSWVMRKIEPGKKPLPMGSRLYASFIEHGYHVSFADLVPILYLTKNPGS